MEQKGYLQRRASKLVRFESKTYRYVSPRANEAAVRARLRALAPERRRFGYRCPHVLLARDGLRLNHMRPSRIDGEERLDVCMRGSQKRALGTCSLMTLPERPIQRWSLDVAISPWSFMAVFLMAGP